MQYQLEPLRSRRSARAKSLRRRRRAVVVALLATLLAAVAVATMTAFGRPVHRAAGAALGPVALPPVVRAPRIVFGRSSRRTAQIAAVERLAAYGLPLYCGGRSERMVALTFDDGPGPYTRLAIAQLRRHHLHATFFLVGREITGHPRLAGLEKAVAAVGDHTMTHPFLPALSHAAMVQQIAGAKTLIGRAAGQRVVLFRPPYEGRTPAIDSEARALGMLEVLWNVDSQDSLGADYAGIERNVIAGLHPGSIVLMHENRGQTIRALPAIFAALLRDRLSAVTVPELVAKDPPSLAQLRAGSRGCGVTRPGGSGN